MVLSDNNIKISSLDDIQKLKAKDLREILKFNSKLTGGIRADLVSKVYALLMWHVLPLSRGENQELLTGVQDLEQNQSDFKYEATMVRIAALGWPSDLRNLPEMNFIQLYSIVSTWKYYQCMLRWTHHEKLKSYQFFWKKLRVKFLKTYIRENVLHSMKKTPYRAVLEFSPTFDVLRTACMYPTGLEIRGKGKCNQIRGVLFAIEDFIRRRFQNNSKP